VLAAIAERPGQRAEEINSTLGTRTPEIAQLLRRLVADQLVRTEGARRGTRYFATGPADVQNGRRAPEAVASVEDTPH
jgi:DNA-binding MarR family transcriptional regulator